MTINNNFQRAYSKLRNELFNALADIQTESPITLNSVMPRKSGFPLDLAKKIALEYEKEQEDEVAEAATFADEFADGQKLKSLLDKLKTQYKDLIKNCDFQLSSGDPIFNQVDPFSPIEWSLEEVPHTKMLAFFLHPQREHGLKNLPLGFFLAAATLRGIKIDVQNYEKTSIKLIEAEKWIRYHDKNRRLDLYIEMEEPQSRILIEGKIKGEEVEDQLSDYKKWFSKNNDDVLIYLTPDGEKPSITDWHPLDWKTVACAFCSLVHFMQKEFTLSKDRKNAQDGFELLRLWTSTLLHHVCKVPVVRYDVEEDSLSNISAFASHIMTIKEILNEYKGGKNGNQD